MTTPESTPADQRLIHDSSHPTYMNPNRDAIRKAEPRTGKTMSDARPSGSYETGVTKDDRRKNGAPRAKEMKTTGECSSGSRSTAPKNMGETGLPPCKSLEEFLTPEELNRLDLKPAVLPHLWYAQLEPPITKATLSELDLERFSTEPQLRHDVFIDRGVSFRPMVTGQAAKYKRQQANRYWDALIIEFALHITRHKLAVERPRLGKAMGSPWLRRTNPQRAPMRLPIMFQVIKEITKTLVPQLEWAVVDARLDIPLLIQELEQGVCDVNGLIAWLGALLLGSCSPMRDSLVQEMVSKVQEGVKTANARVIVDGLRDLFGILEIMKLDVANHQLRILRILMVEDCIRFQQKVFIHRIAREPALRNAHSWFRIPRGLDRENVYSHFHDLNLLERRDEVIRSDLAIFMNALVDLVVSNSLTFPATFECDVQRLRRVQADFHDCVRMETYHDIFVKVVEHLGYVVYPCHRTNESLTKDIADLTAHLDAVVGSPVHFQTVTLEIVRQAYRYCGAENLPSDALLQATEATLCRAQKPESFEFGQAQALLFNRLYDTVEDHVLSTIHLQPLSIIDQLNPLPSDPYALEEDVNLLHVARRLAHVLVLHWKIWAPILYQQPWSRVLSSVSAENSWFGTGGDGGGDGDGGGPGDGTGGGPGDGLGENFGSGDQTLSWGGDSGGDGNNGGGAEHSMDFGTNNHSNPKDTL